MGDQWTETGRFVTEDGAIKYEWPPVGRFRDLWERFESLEFTDEEKSEVLALLKKWQHETSTLVSYTNESGDWVDVSPDWDEVGRWLKGQP